MNTLVIARLTFKEAARRKILLATLVLGIVFLIVFGLGILEQNEISGFLYTAGLNVVNS
jgi:hypothetical protein